jgi:two-component system, OmpR family, KDP operon response regulator KdpE
MTRLLIVEEDDNIRLSLVKALRQHGHYVSALPNTDQLAAQLAIVRPDLLILDLPPLLDIERLTECEEVRTWSSVPILLSSTLANRPSPARIFKAGADGLVLKPFAIVELMASIESILQRRDVRSTMALVTVHAGQLTIDLKAQQVSVQGERIRLTPKEYDLLSVLASAEGGAVSHQLLTTSLWGQTDFRTRTHLHALVRRLRKKLRESSLHDPYIVCEPRFGYRLLITSVTPSMPA